MTRNVFIFTKLEVPIVYKDEHRQGLYETEYRNGRAHVDLGKGKTISLERISFPNHPECIRGYLDGIRDEMLFQLGESEE